MPTNKGSSENLQKKAASIIASNISRDLDVTSLDNTGSIEVVEKVLVDIFKIISEDSDDLVREKMSICYARVDRWLIYRSSI